MPSLEPMMRQYFLEYASYVIVDRAFPEILDGCKPVQRRILHTLFQMDDGKFIKAANVIGECMKLHPHGDASIGDALVVLANKGFAPANDNLGYFIEKQGNYGNRFTGHGPAAPRYIECRLSPLAKETLFNPALTAFVPSYDGRKEEPEALPAKLPVVLLLGTEGIGVGMATTILPHNLSELLQAEIKHLKGERFRIYPDFPQGGLMDVSEYSAGNGLVKLRAKIETVDEKTIVIREIPPGTTTESLVESIEAAVEKGKVKISEISDRTSDQVEIVLRLQRGVYADEVLPQLYAYTDCEVKISSNIIVIRDGKPAELSVNEVLAFCAERLKGLIKAELEHELAQLADRQHWLTLEQVFIEGRVYKRIENAKTEEAVREAVWSGMKPFAATFVRPMVEEDVDRLLEIRIKRISAFDIDKSRKDLEEVAARIRTAKAKLKDLVGTTIAWLEYIDGKYGKLYPRRTRVKAMEEIDKKAVANANIRMAYDPATGFFGTAVRGGERELRITEYDKVIVITQDGMYRIMGPTEKTVIEGKIIHLDVFDPEKGLALTVIYRDKARCPWGKKVHIQSFVKDREYELIKDRAGRIELLLPEPATGTAMLQFVPSPRAREAELEIDLAKIEVAGVQTRGTKLADRQLAKVVVRK